MGEWGSLHPDSGLAFFIRPPHQSTFCLTAHRRPTASILTSFEKVYSIWPCVGVLSWSGVAPSVRWTGSVRWSSITVARLLKITRKIGYRLLKLSREKVGISQMGFLIARLCLTRAEANAFPICRPIEAFPLYDDHIVLSVGKARLSVFHIIVSNLMEISIIPVRFWSSGRYLAFDIVSQGCGHLGRVSHAETSTRNVQQSYSTFPQYSSPRTFMSWNLHQPFWSCY